MSRQWMPLYVSDYFKDTNHLTAIEHGAYLLLIMEYWSRGSLPTDERRLARLARMNDREWAASRGVIKDLFMDDWTHKRIEEEIKKADAVSSKRSASASRRWNKGDA